VSERKENKVIHVDKLIVHAKEVEIIHERNEDHQHHMPRRPRRDPWGFFWGGQRPEQDERNGQYEERSND